MKHTRRKALGIMAGAAVTPCLSDGAPKHTFGIQGDRFVLDGKPFIIRSGEIHYARIPREDCATA